MALTTNNHKNIPFGLKLIGFNQLIIGMFALTSIMSGNPVMVVFGLAIFALVVYFYQGLMNLDNKVRIWLIWFICISTGVTIFQYGYVMLNMGQLVSQLGGSPVVISLIFGIPRILINVVIVWYLTRPHIKNLFTTKK